MVLFLAFSVDSVLSEEKKEQAILKEVKEKQFCAFLGGTHPRLGHGSAVSLLNQDVLEVILSFFKDEDVSLLDESKKKLNIVALKMACSML